MVLDKTTAFLRRYGAVILGAFLSPGEAYCCITNRKPDLIVLDVGLNKGNECDFIQSFEASVSGVLIIYINSRQLFNPSIIDDATARFRLLPFLDTIASVKTDIHGVPDSLSIKCFGRFRIVKNNKEFKFATKKVCELFAFLISHYNRNVYREDILRALFNSGDRQRDSNNFRVTMYRLRSALSKANISKQQLLIDKNYAVHMTRGLCDLVDFIDFMKEGKAVSDHNITWVNRIIDSIEGELFSDIDTLWLTDIREYTSVHIEELMISTAQYYMKSPEGQEAAERILKKLLHINDVSEACYMALLDLYIATGKKNKYGYLYKRYANILRKELNSVPDRKYTRYYLELNNE
jgi:two-component SAPR family response regulator